MGPAATVTAIAATMPTTAATAVTTRRRLRPDEVHDDDQHAPGPTTIRNGAMREPLVLVIGATPAPVVAPPTWARMSSTGTWMRSSTRAG